MPGILQPVWSGHVAYRESFLPLAEDDGSIEDIELLYEADEIKEVVSSTLQLRYEEGRDYLLRGGKLRIPRGSRIPYMKKSEYYPAQAVQGQTFGRTGGGNLRFAERDFFHRLQTLVTYRHGDVWTGNIPRSKLELLPNTGRRLKAGEDMKLLFYGDSITVGGNASGFISAPPFQRYWCALVTDELENRYGSRINVTNTAVGGTNSAWGAANARERAAKYRPDLLVLAFGMNDGRLEAEKHVENIKQIMAAVKAENNECEFLLVAPMLANREAEGFFGNQISYAPALLELEAPGTAVCNVTQLHQRLLERKSYRDMTGNNINHPNDYLSRVYAQAVLAVLGAQDE